MRSTPLTDLIESMGKADAERDYQVCLESIGKIANLCDEIGDPCGFTWKSRPFRAGGKSVFSGKPPVPTSTCEPRWMGGPWSEARMQITGILFAGMQQLKKSREVARTIPRDVSGD